jgi:hypothetical protein
MTTQSIAAYLWLSEVAFFSSLFVSHVFICVLFPFWLRFSSKHTGVIAVITLCCAVAQRDPPFLFPFLSHSCNTTTLCRAVFLGSPPPSRYCMSFGQLSCRRRLISFFFCHFLPANQFSQ